MTACYPLAIPEETVIALLLLSPKIFGGVSFLLHALILATLPRKNLLFDYLSEKVGILLGLTISKGTAEAMPERLLYIYLNITRTGYDLAFAAGYSFRHIDTSRIGFGYKNLFRKQSACYVTCTCFDIDLCGITTFKYDVPRTSFNRKILSGNHVFQDDIPRTSA